ncbi:MAG: type II toxin-antitoxin system VapC family toxin [Burkholderiales bacterium]
MIYLDTSVVVPLIVPESGSAKVCAWRDRLTALQLREATLSAWTITEFASAIGLTIRQRDLTRAQGDAALKTFHDLLVPSLTVLEPVPTDFRLVETMLRECSLGLRAGDALHLAIAVRGSARPFVALDRDLCKAASAMGIAVAPG